MPNRCAGSRGSSSLLVTAGTLALSAASFGSFERAAANEPAPPVPATAPAAPDAEQTPPLRTMAERMEVLTLIKTTSDRSQDADDRKVQAVEIKPMVDDYLQSLQHATDLSVEELALAKAVNFGEINMLHYSRNPGPQSADFINTVALPFYEKLVPVIREYAKNNPEVEKETGSILNSIRGDINWCDNHKLPEVSIRAADSMALLFATKEHCTSLRDFKRMCNFDDPRYILRLLSLRRELATDLIEQSFLNITEDHLFEPEVALALFEFHTLVSDVLQSRKGQPDSSELAETRNWLRQTLSLPLFEQIVPAYGRTFSSSGTRRLQEDLIPSATRLIDFLREEADPVSLGNQYVSYLEQYMQKNSTTQAFRSATCRLLAGLAPEPNNTHFLVDAINEQLINSSGTSGIVAETGHNLGAVLLSHLQHSLHTETSDPSSFEHSSALFASFLDAHAAPTDAGGKLLPAHRLLARIASAGSSQNAAAGFPALAHADPDTSRQLSSACDDITRLVITELARCYDRDLVPGERAQSRTDFPVPAAWGVGVVRPPDSAAPEQFRAQVRSLHSLTDSMAVRYADFPADSSRDQILERVIYTLDIHDEIQKNGNPTGQRVLSALTENFPYLALRTEDQGPFAHAFLRCQEILYHNTHGRPAPEKPPLDPLFARHQWRDPRLDALALQYAQTAEERFACDLILALLSDSQESRPLEHHQILSIGRMQNELRSLLLEIGLAGKNIAPPRVYQKQDPASSSLESILSDTPPDQFKEAVSRRSDRLRTLQRNLLQQVQRANVR